MKDGKKIKMRMITPVVLAAILLGAGSKLYSQGAENRYSVETTFNGKTPVLLEQNLGILKINSATEELLFTADLAKLKTGDSKTDSLLAGMQKLPFAFQGNFDTGLFDIIRDENDDRYHKVMGTVTIAANTYPAEAFVRIENFSDKSNLSKALLDMKLEIDPKKMFIPCLSDYFNNVIVFQVNDGFIGQNRQE